MTSAMAESRGSLMLARRKAEQRGPDIFSGEDALREVAKPSGQWNWALVAPDPVEMPLSGGGRGSIEEMRDTIGKHAHSFGLLRMEFGVPPDVKTRFLFIHASDPVDSGKFTAVQRGKAMAVVSKMEKFVQAIVAYAAKIDIQHPDECTIPNVVAKLLEVVRGMGSEGLTEAEFMANREFMMAQNAEEEERNRKILDEVKVIEEAAAPNSVEVAEPEQELPTVKEEEEEPVKQRKKVKLYSLGDQVEVWSSKNNVWYMDAEVVDVAKETSQIDGIRIKAGSMKVVYDNGARFKWVPPQQMEGYLRPSPRPKSPPPLTGELARAASGWFSTQWEKTYCELNRGFLQWWAKRDDARRGGIPTGKLYLRGLQQKDDGDKIQLRTDASAGAVYSFKAESEADAKKWTEAFWAHAGYCEEMSEFQKAQSSGQEMRKQLLATMQSKTGAAS